ncbi:hypothetical protein BGZ60DRAFT_529281 [Tricladium varicosporioides]|nr:hypothetical protein BGZ60DRAFT_529281 [Hymenoscyphus varicosporioides]
MTFHSAHDHTQMEMRPMSQPSTVTRTIPKPISPTKNSLPSPKIESIKMDRQDSGYSDTIHASPRTSSSSRRSSPSKDVPPTNPKPKRRTTNSSSHSTKSSTRPGTKRASRSSPIPTSTLMQARNSVSGSSRRPSMAARGHTHSASTPYHTNSQTYQFFHFPTFDPVSNSSHASNSNIAQEEMSELEVDTPRNHPPPATTQYWTSDSTRRLEYAAIDAAGKGVKGFLIRCVPDCILPVEKRRTRFCGEDGIDEDCGSVRRYRLALPEEKSLVGGDECCSKSRPGFIRRWTTFGKRRGSC